MKKHYTDEKNVQILIALLKANGIKRIIASPGTTNMAFVQSLDNDGSFEMYSAVDERSAAYMACGLAEETGEPVVITCTGATASRNYLPGLTEAFYRKLPILSVTASQDISKIGHLSAQLIDRTVMPIDTVKYAIHLPIIKDKDDWWSCEVKTNSAISELFRNGGGPVHVNLTTEYSKMFNVETLPKVRVIKRFTYSDKLPSIENKKVAIFIGSHSRMSKELTHSIDRFCESNNAVVFCDHTSGYYGKYKLMHSISSSQTLSDSKQVKPELTIHIGDVTGDYSATKIIGNTVWRVSEDGEIRDTFKKIQSVFQMKPESFFEHYSKNKRHESREYLSFCKEHLAKLNQINPEIPFSNVWIAKKAHKSVPENSVMHFAILNSLRSWNYFNLPKNVESSSNVGGFGIDGGVSTLIGASFANKDKLYFCVVGDLAFFYDMNSIGNRHVGNNIRILLINNGKGVEFRNFNHPASAFGESADKFHAAGGHFGNQSKTLVKSYSESLGFKYISASSKSEFEEVYQDFFANKITNKPMLLEVFTDSTDESNALETMMTLDSDISGRAKSTIKGMLGDSGLRKLKGILKK